jgi:hypothetical protein
MWSEAERSALARVIEQLDDRTQIEAWLGRSYALLGVIRQDGVEYSGPGVGGWIRVRYVGSRVRAVVVVAAADLVASP